MRQKNRDYIFERASIPLAVASLCLPTVLSSLIMACYSLADTFFVGMINDPIQNAAVTLASPALMMFDCVVALFGVGSSSLMSRSLGKKDLDAVHSSSAMGIYLASFGALALSALFLLFKRPLLRFLGADGSTFDLTEDYLTWTFCFGAFPYILHLTIANLMRAEGHTAEASIGIMSGCILNIILDPIFVLPFGLNMGVVGAGCATFLSHCFSCVLFVFLLIQKRGQTNVCVHPKYFCPSVKLIREMCAVGVPAMINKMLTVSSQIVLNNALAHYGAQAVAAMGIAFRIDILPLDVCIGVSQGIMPLIGYNYGAGNTNRMKEAWLFTVKTATVIMVSVMTLYLLIPEMLVGLFIQNGQVIQIGAGLLRGMCLALPFYGFTSIAIGVFQACGMGGSSLLIALCRQVVLMIPSILLLDWMFGLYGIAYSYLVSEVILVTVSAFLLRRLFRRY